MRLFNWQKSVYKLKKLKSIFIIIFLVFNFCEPETRIVDSVQVGMTKAEIRQLLGKPEIVDTIEKNTEIIWGAEEAFWAELPLGATLEIWIYEREENEVRLYFIDESDTLSYKIIALKDAV
ncbi:MAG: outer membrane protein assembly factor BamE, partial [Calditrichia bacterium]|nr:outer membrane protein assembly factor BamE [Calditrichia bacterium]